MVGNLNKRYAFVHAVILTIEDHRSVKFARTCAFPGDS